MEVYSPAVMASKCPVQAGPMATVGQWNIEDGNGRKERL